MTKKEGEGGMNYTYSDFVILRCNAHSSSFISQILRIRDDQCHIITMRQKELSEGRRRRVGDGVGRGREGRRRRTNIEWW